MTRLPSNLENHLRMRVFPVTWQKWR